MTRKYENWDEVTAEVGGSENWTPERKAEILELTKDNVLEMFDDAYTDIGKLNLQAVGSRYLASLVVMAEEMRDEMREAADWIDSVCDNLGSDSLEVLRETAKRLRRSSWQGGK